MTPPFDWDACYREHVADPGSRPYPALVGRLAAPTAEDTAWVIKALKDDRRWFLGWQFEWAPAIDEIFFRPLLDAGIDECEPSGCRPYICSCARVFGASRSREYLHKVIEFERDHRKVGALLTLYWCIPQGRLGDEIGGISWSAKRASS